MGRDTLSRDLAEVIFYAWSSPFLTKSNFARHHADAIAECASLGYLSTRMLPFCPVHGKSWRATPEGLIQFWEYSQRNHKELLKNYGLSQEKDKDSPD